jgi:two-component system, chemotaxis family, protein-glutamate methylesterase/glutaminase
MEPDRIRVLIVDDSHTTQKLFSRILDDDHRFELVAVASNGREAVDYVARFKPDIVSMDLNMPLMDGMEATREIMQKNPVPILIVSSYYDVSDQEMAIQALDAGAVSIMPKPAGIGHPDYQSTVKGFLRMLRTLSEVKVVRRKTTYRHSNNRIGQNENLNYAKFEPTNDYKILIIGASAGGPESTKIILSSLSPGFPLPVVIVQHIDAHFSEGYRLWLNSYSGIPVLIPSENQHLLPGHAYVAPGGKHLVLKGEGIATFSDAPPDKGHKPSVSQLFKSAGQVFGSKVIAVILSGMGSDGAKELKNLRDLGAMTFTQNEATCLVYGMPGEAVKLGAASKVLSPDKIIHEILELYK